MDDDGGWWRMMMMMMMMLMLRCSSRPILANSPPQILLTPTTTSPRYPTSRFPAPQTSCRISHWAPPCSASPRPASPVLRSKRAGPKTCLQRLTQKTMGIFMGYCCHWDEPTIFHYGVCVQDHTISWDVVMGVSEHGSWLYHPTYIPKPCILNRMINW